MAWFSVILHAKLILFITDPAATEPLADAWWLKITESNYLYNIVIHIHDKIWSRRQQQMYYKMQQAVKHDHKITAFIVYALYKYVQGKQL